MACETVAQCLSHAQCTLQAAGAPARSSCDATQPRPWFMLMLTENRAVKLHIPFPLFKEERTPGQLSNTSYNLTCGMPAAEMERMASGC